MSVILTGWHRSGVGDLRCGRCASEPRGVAPWRCEVCGSPLELDLPPADAATLIDRTSSGVWRYRGWLPTADVVTLGEPVTGLVELRGRPGVFAKLEGSLPTGSFKDRGVAVTVGWLVRRGVRELIVDSSGNAGASFAAYAARAGIRARVFVPADASPAKLVQVRAHGASIVTVPGPRSAAGDAARAALDDAGPGVAYASHLWQPAFLTGTATFAYEVVEALGRAPDTVIAPLGGGTLLLGARWASGGSTRLASSSAFRGWSACNPPPARHWPARSGRERRTRSPWRPGRPSPRASGSPGRRGPAKILAAICASWRHDRRGRRRCDPDVAADAARGGHLRRADLGGRPCRAGARRRPRRDDHRRAHGSRPEGFGRHRGPGEVADRRGTSGRPRPDRARPGSRSGPDGPRDHASGGDHHQRLAQHREDPGADPGPRRAGPPGGRRRPRRGPAVAGAALRRPSPHEAPRVGSSRRPPAPRGRRAGCRAGSP